MAISQVEGTETITTSEWSLTTDTAGPDADTTDCIVQVFVDLNALAAGDQYTLSFYEKAQSTDTQRKVASWVFDGAQSMPLFASPSFIVMNGWDFTLLKNSGTDRAITWSVRKIT
jgi:hypothetical protein